MERIRAIVADLRAMTPTVLEIVLQREEGGAFADFIPGQYATLSFPRHPRIRGERSFSIASSPTDPSQLRFGIRLSGRYTSALRELRRGDRDRTAVLPYYASRGNHVRQVHEPVYL